MVGAFTRSSRPASRYGVAEDHHATYSVGERDGGRRSGTSTSSGMSGYFGGSSRGERGVGGNKRKNSAAAAAKGAAARRQHAGAETREELEALPDDVLEAIALEERNLPVRDRGRGGAHAGLDDEHDDLAADADGDAHELRGDDAATAEAVLDLEDNEADVAFAEEKLARALAEEAARSRISLVKAILAERRDRAERRVYRRCFAIARSTVGDRAVIDLEDFKRFIHRGLDTEAVDQWELKRLYTGCLQGRPGSRVAVSDTLDVDQLRHVIEQGQWKRHWSRYVRDAR